MFAVVCCPRGTNKRKRLADGSIGVIGSFCIFKELSLVLIKVETKGQESLLA